RMRAKNYESLGYSYSKINDYGKAIENYKKYQFLSNKLGDTQGEAASFNAIGQAYFAKGDYNNALKNFKKALTLVKSIGDREAQAQLERNIAICEAKIGGGTARTELQDAQTEALVFQERYEVVRDSLLEARQMVMEAQAELEDKEAEIQQKEEVITTLEEAQTVLAREKEVLAMEKEIQDKLILYAGTGGAIAILLLLIIAALAVSRSRIKTKANRELSQEKKKSDDLLRNILPEPIAEELKRNQAKEARQQKQKKKGQKAAKQAKALPLVRPIPYQQVSVMFTDFKGFTTVAARTAPEVLIQELNECFNEFDEIIERHNLEKIKTIGDAYMCAGGIPKPNRTNALDTIAAAMEMQEFMRRWKAEREKNNQSTWELRIGIHTGKVIAGVIGKKKFAYDIWGDTVNIASRLESASEPWKINISKVTYDLVKQQYECSPRGPLPIKNRGTVDMFFVERKL
ncbi:MAG: adenylate/guanylate cyclase domain-containing protein, partial [Bacteroidota bacterium]